MLQLFVRSSLPFLFILLTPWHPHSIPFASPASAEPAEQEQRDSIVPTVVKALGFPDPSVAVQPYVKKITLQGDYGLANWERGDAGGTVALISHRRNTWTVIRLGGGLPSPSDLSQRTGMPITLAKTLLDEHMGTYQGQFVPTYCNPGESTFLAVETTSYWINICGVDKPMSYIGVEKGNPQQLIRIPLQSYSLNSPQFTAVNGPYTYILGNSAKGKTLTVSNNSRELLREPILRGL